MVSTEKELADAIKNGQDIIVIEGDLSQKIVRIKATGKLAWAVAIGSFGVALAASLYPAPDPATQAGAKFVVAPSCFIAGSTILGASTASSALVIAVAAGGVGVLNKLRKYKIASKSQNRVVIQKS